jgi:hypothetical protein
MREILLICFTGFLWLAFLMGQLFVVYIIYRSYRVYCYRKKVLNDTRYTVAEREHKFKALPSYDRMVWQLRKFNWDDCFIDSE